MTVGGVSFAADMRSIVRDMISTQTVKHYNSSPLQSPFPISGRISRWRTRWERIGRKKARGVDNRQKGKKVRKSALYKNLNLKI